MIPLVIPLYILFTQRFFGEPKMVFLWHHCEKPVLKSLFLRVYFILMLIVETSYK